MANQQLANNEAISSQFIGCCPQEFKDRITALEECGQLYGYEEKIRQIPHSSNNNVAIVSTKIALNKKNIEQVGIVVPEDIEGNVNPHALLFEAGRQAFGKVLVAFHSVSQNSGRAVIDVPAAPVSPPETDYGPTPIAKSSTDKSVEKWKQPGFRHSGKKPMSPKQREALIGMSQQHGEDFEDLCQRITGKPSNQLTSRDSQKMFEHFKNTKGDVFG